MRLPTIICTIILWTAISIGLGGKLYGQTMADLNQLEHAIQKPHEHNWVASANTDDEFKILFSGLFLFYKEFISSQDGQECTFTPSCSVYGMTAVKNDGVIMGFIKTCDRLIRCNGLSPEKYEYDESTGKLYDPFH